MVTAQDILKKTEEIVEAKDTYTKHQLRKELKGMVETAEQPFIYSRDCYNNPFWFCLKKSGWFCKKTYDLETFEILLSAKNLPGFVSDLLLSISHMLFLGNNARVKFSLAAQKILIPKHERIWRSFLKEIHIGLFAALLKQQTDDKQLMIFKEVLADLIQHYTSLVDTPHVKNDSVKHHLKLLREQWNVVINKLAPCSQLPEYAVAIESLPREVRKRLEKGNAELKKLYSERSPADQNFLAEANNQLRIMETEQRSGRNNFSPKDIYDALTQVKENNGIITTSLDKLLSQILTELKEMMPSNSNNEVLQISYSQQ